ncbi:MAG: hypothetical protein NT027_12250 [Proteobacteria bacterium]|nr:hypothetical protein [Pseudomonadota bacterium]
MNRYMVIAVAGALVASSLPGFAELGYCEELKTNFVAINLDSETCKLQIKTEEKIHELALPFDAQEKLIKCSFSKVYEGTSVYAHSTYHGKKSGHLLLRIDAQTKSLKNIYTKNSYAIAVRFSSQLQAFPTQMYQNMEQLEKSIVLVKSLGMKTQEQIFSDELHAEQKAFVIPMSSHKSDKILLNLR